MNRDMLVERVVESVALRAVEDLLADRQIAYIPAFFPTPEILSEFRVQIATGEFRESRIRAALRDDLKPYWETHVKPVLRWGRLVDVAELVTTSLLHGLFLALAMAPRHVATRWWHGAFSRDAAVSTNILAQIITEIAAKMQEEYDGI